jgi:beta-glucosidase
MTILKFPEKFYWGAATSSHQVEGHNHNDWSEWEKLNANRLAQEAHKHFAHLPSWQFTQTEAENPTNYISGSACDHYHRFREDFDIAQSLHHNAHRFSIEWSRIEPEEGKFDEKEIEHYRQVIQALRERGIEPFVTLWHWTLPVWLSEKGGVRHSSFPAYFERYTETIVKALGNDVKFWITLNEPTSVIGAAYINGNWPPQKNNPFTAWRLYKNFARAHNLAFDAIHKIDSHAQVGLANILHSFEPYRQKSFLDRLAIKIGKYLANEKLLNLTQGKHDFLAVQYYFHNRIKFPRKISLHDKPITDLGWEIYPEGLYHTLKNLQPYKLPIYITENGLADASDTKRADFIRAHLVQINKAISDGADVRGYFHWSLLDNFEWDKGFWPRFGLVEIDYKTQERHIRPSAFVYGKIAEMNALEIN